MLMFIEWVAYFAIALLVSYIVLLMIYRKEKLNEYFEIMHNRIFKHVHIISMRYNKTIYGHNYSKNMGLLNRCIKDIEGRLQSGQVYKFRTHELILKKIKKSDCIKIISCKKAEHKSIKGLNDVLHGKIIKSFITTIIYMCPFMNRFDDYRVQFYNIKICLNK